MEHVDLHEMGELIRRVRKSRGLRLEDLADEQISPATISNIERGVPHVNRQKVHYLLAKLHLDVNELQKMMVKSQAEQAELEHQFTAAETLIEMGQPLLADEWLSMDMDDHHPFTVRRYRLQGRLAMERSDWKKAERLFQHGLRVGKDQSDFAAMAQSHLELACLYYTTGQWSRSLHHTDSGLEICPEEETDTRIHLLLLQALSQKASGRWGDCLQTVQQVWDSGSLGSPTMELEWTRLYGEILYRNRFWEKAEQIINKGLLLARQYRNRRALFHLWALSGRTAIKRQMWKRAEISLRTALVWEAVSDDPAQPIAIRIQLGQICAEREQFEQAYRWLQEAKERSAAHDDPRPHIEVLLALGEWEENQKDKTQAMTYYQEARDKSHDHGLVDLEHEAWFRLTRMWEEKGDSRFDEGMREVYALQKKMREV